MHDLIYSLSRNFVHVSRLLGCRCVHNCFFLRVVRNTQIFIRFGINAVLKFNLGVLSIDTDVQHRALFIGLAVIRESPIDYFPQFIDFGPLLEIIFDLSRRFLRPKLHCQLISCRKRSRL